MEALLHNLHVLPTVEVQSKGSLHLPRAEFEHLNYYHLRYYFTGVNHLPTKCGLLLFSARSNSCCRKANILAKDGLSLGIGREHRKNRGWILSGIVLGIGSLPSLNTCS